MANKRLRVQDDSVTEEEKKSTTPVDWKPIDANFEYRYVGTNGDIHVRPRGNQKHIALIGAKGGLGAVTTNQHYRHLKYVSVPSGTGIKFAKANLDGYVHLEHDGIQIIQSDKEKSRAVMVRNDGSIRYNSTQVKDFAKVCVEIDPAGTVTRTTTPGKHPMG